MCSGQDHDGPTVTLQVFYIMVALCAFSVHGTTRYECGDTINVRYSNIFTSEDEVQQFMPGKVTFSQAENAAVGSLLQSDGSTICKSS